MRTGFIGLGAWGCIWRATCRRADCSSWPATAAGRRRRTSRQPWPARGRCGGGFRRLRRGRASACPPMPTCCSMCAPCPRCSRRQRRRRPFHRGGGHRAPGACAARCARHRFPGCARLRRRRGRAQRQVFDHGRRRRDRPGKARPVLEAYALRITHMGASGSGQATKAVNQVLVAGIAQAVCEGLALGEKLGLDPALLVPTLAAGAAGNWFLDKRGATMLADNFTPGFKSALLHKDLLIVRGMARDAGIRATRDRTVDRRLRRTDARWFRRRGHLGADPAQARRLSRRPVT